MAAFTDAQTLDGVIPVAMTPFAALPTTTPALVPYENTNSTATTPPSSPAYKKDYFGPCTPTSTSTPLHRRFLRSISMSPAIPSPSTPTRNSPAKAQSRATPAHRKSESPIKLEVGQNAFYFSIELPTSKITPKKTGTPTSKATTPRDAGQGTPTKTPTVKELAARYQETDLGTSTRRSSPLKNANSVKEDPATPTRRTRSPAKNPASIKQSPARPLFDTPKSHQTPNTGSGTPTQRTTSPLKSHSPVKRSPARALFGTLTKMPASGRPGSPIKRAIERLPTEPEKKVSKLAEKLLSKPTETPMVAPECLTDATKEDPSRMATNTSAVTSVAQVDPLVETARAAAKVRPENIGHLIANLGSSSKVPTIQAEDANRLSASPAPTPLRRASQRLSLAEFPSFVRLSTNRASGETNGDVKAAGSSPSYQEANDRQQEDKQTGTTAPEPETAEEIRTFQTTATQTVDQDHRTVNVSHEEQPMHLRRADPGLSNALDMTRNDQTPKYQYPPLLFPKPEPEPAPVAKQNVLQPPSKQHMQRQEMDASNTKVQRQSPSAQHRRIGTDPSVILKMQQEMANLEATMRRSAGVVDANFCGPLNLNELPAMSNSFFSSRRDLSDVRSPGAIGSPRALSRTNSTTSSIETVRESMVTSAQNRSQLTTRVSSTPKIPRWKPSGPTPAQTKRDKLMAAKQMRSEKMSGPRTLRSRPSSVASGTSSKASTKATATPRDTIVSPTVHKSPSLTRIPNSPISRIPSTTLMKFKTTTTAVPTSARNPTLNSSTPKVPAPGLTRRLSRLKSPQSTPQLRGPARSIKAPQPYTPWVDTHPSSQKFASAIDIASRLKEWHSEDRARASAETPRSKIPVKPPPPAALKTPTRISTKSEEVKKQSYTPVGSPTKLLTPIKESQTPSPRKPRPLLSSNSNNPPSTPKAALAPTSKPTTVAPKTPLPKTTPALARLKHPKTPANRRTSTLDRNATCTPSKAIVSSLDRAIDEKIAEDARSGREFTPSGNRVADLLDARRNG